MGDSYPDNHPARPSGRGAATPKSATPPAFGSGSPANRRRGNTLRLFGREGEQVRLRQLLNAAVGGSSGLLLIGGEAGIGKTTLATFIEYEAHGRGIRV
jgi:DNA-binding NtrC family response regulator